VSDRHPKRSRCRICSETVRIAPTRARLFVHVRNAGFWLDGRASLCTSCREAWWSPMQLELPLVFDQVDTALMSGQAGPSSTASCLPATAPSASEPIPLTASWPRSRLRAQLDARRSALWR
jgi:hypothetical protein